MTIRRLDKTQWQGYFDRVAKGLAGRQVEVEVAGLSLGDQIEAEWVAVTGVTYDPKGNLVEVTSENIDHLIRDPRDIHVDDDVEGLHSIEVVDGDDNHQIIKLRSPLVLAAS